MQDIAFGKERVRVWPSSRGKPKSKAQKEQQERFALVQRMAHYLAPEAMAYIHKAVANSPLLPRDVVTMQLFNRWMAFDLEDGRTLWPMPAYNDVSEALDVITKTMGDYLVRNVDGWRGASTLPSPPTKLKQAQALLSANIPGTNGVFNHVPFNQIEGDPGGWWKGGPDNAWKPDVPGFYELELRIRKTSNNINVVWVSKNDLSIQLLQGADIGGIRAAVVTGMIYLDGNTAVTAGGFNSAGGTIEGGVGRTSFFKITGPF